MRLDGIAPDIRMVAFDWNGTLVPDWPVSYGAIKTIFTFFGLKAPTEEATRREIGANYMEFYFRHGIPRPETEKGQLAIKAKLNQIRNSYLSENWESVKLAEGAENILRILSDKKVFSTIVSAENPEILQRRLVQFQIRSYFDHVISGASAKDGKFIALRGLSSRFRVRPENCVYVDDTYDGISSAKLAGMRTIGILGGYNTDELVRRAYADATLTSLDKIKEILV